MRDTAFSSCQFGSWLVVIALSAGALRADDANSADDGWRRTARGWERTAAWTDSQASQNFEQFTFERLEPQPRWDVHPALLVAAQVLLVFGAYRLWPVPACKASLERLHKGKEDAVEPQVELPKVA